MCLFLVGVAARLRDTVAAVMRMRRLGVFWALRNARLGPRRCFVGRDAGRCVADAARGGVTGVASWSNRGCRSKDVESEELVDRDECRDGGEDEGGDACGDARGDGCGDGRGVVDGDAIGDADVEALVEALVEAEGETLLEADEETLVEADDGFADDGDTVALGLVAAAGTSSDFTIEPELLDESVLLDE